MGASSAKLFDDDLAADIRELFQELLQRGETAASATQALLQNFDDIIDTEEETVFWLALAAVQWEYASLQPNVRNRALKIIANGTDLAHWPNNSELQRQRKKILAKLAERLQVPNSKPKQIRLRKKLPLKCDWKAGEVIAYQLASKQYILLRIISVLQSLCEESPTCELLDWLGTELPIPETIALLPIRRNKRYPSESMFSFPLLKKHLSRCRSLNLHLTPTLKDAYDYKVPLNFNDLPAELAEYFGISVENYQPQSATSTVNR